ncbi:MAG: gamma-glutamyltransferase [Phycisphaerae bacterium]|nr:gamma-glutamyltransferase [Phycisphaerae bacterium]
MTRRLTARGKRQNSRSETPFLTVKTTGEALVPQSCHVLLILAALAASVFTSVGCTGGPHASWSVDGTHTMVAADHEAASQAGAEILVAGGNAVDAAVATSFALAVVRPESCGLGGGGFMIVHRPDGLTIALDYREAAPAGATLDHYLDDDNRPIAGKTRLGAWAVAVPGTVHGLLHALEQYGSGRLSTWQILAPAIRLARSPLEVDAHLHEAMTKLAEDCREHPRYRERFAELCRRFLENGEAVAVGDDVDRSDIAMTLEAIARRGARGFYDGPVADKIVAEIQHRGGPLTKDDLVGYSVRMVEPLRGRFGPYEIIAMPPPSSGGAVILEMLNVLSQAGRPITELDTTNPADAHLLVEAMKHAFAERAALLGDRSPQVMADVGRMISQDHARDVWSKIDPDKTKPAKSYGLQTTPDDGGTSHFCVVDADGMAVCCTETINLAFGSRILVPGTGVILNNEMDDFAVDTRTPNAFGLRQSARNLIRPGRRPLSSMSPTIALRDGKVELLAGASGGPKIITATLQTILNALTRGMPIDEAIAAPRMHHQWLPDQVNLQRAIKPAVLRGLLDRGHAVRWYSGSAGCVQAIQRTTTGWRGACDPSKGGRPVGG